LNCADGKFRRPNHDNFFQALLCGSQPRWRCVPLVHSLGITLAFKSSEVALHFLWNYDFRPVSVVLESLK